MCEDSEALSLHMGVCLPSMCLACVSLVCPPLPRPARVNPSLGVD